MKLTTIFAILDFLLAQESHDERIPPFSFFFMALSCTALVICLQALVGAEQIQFRQLVSLSIFE